MYLFFCKTAPKQKGFKKKASPKRYNFKGFPEKKISKKLHLQNKKVLSRKKVTSNF
jgi:hypothetical protein